VAITVHGDVVYVLNGGGAGSVSGFRVAGSHLDAIPNSTRSLGLGGTNPPAFLASPAQVGFSPDGRHLVVTTKTHNTIDVFRVRPGGRVSSSFVANPSASPVPFAFTWSRTGDLVLTEAGASTVTVYRIRRDDTVSVRGGPLSDGQKALCWIAGARGHFFGSNTGTKTISAYAIDAKGDVSFAGAPDGIVATTDAVPVDLAVTRGGRFLYVQEPTSGELQGYQVHADGSLTLVTTVPGLPTATPMEGIVAA
jgi:6-phosphogluconolactonase (cycloisomerase 2 family)